jgi:hypothetical protein
MGREGVEESIVEQSRRERQEIPKPKFRGRGEKEKWRFPLTALNQPDWVVLLGLLD